MECVEYCDFERVFVVGRLIGEIGIVFEKVGGD